MEAVSYNEAWGNYRVCPACCYKTPERGIGVVLLVFDERDPGRWWRFHPVCWDEWGDAFKREWQISPEAL